MLSDGQHHAEPVSRWAQNTYFTGRKTMTTSEMVRIGSEPVKCAGYAQLHSSQTCDHSVIAVHTGNMLYVSDIHIQLN